jgi:phage shock protein PspC (stress-responsive transcriptional regulator)
MGRPEQFETEADNAQPIETSGNSKRFYRDVDNKVIGGVCSGLGAYFNIDPVILRVLFVILSFPLAGFPLALYLVFWIIIPAAFTTAQKMEMRGGNFTISDIENRVKTEYENVKGNFKNKKDSEYYRTSRNQVNTIGNGLAEVINFVGRVFLILIGLVLIITGISLIVGLFGAIVFSDSFMFWTHTGQSHAFLPDFLSTLIHPKTLILAVVCLLIFIALPIITIIYWGLKLILRFKTNDRIIAIVGSIAWILSIIILTGIALYEVRGYAYSTKIEDAVDLNLPENRTLYLELSEEIYEFSEIYIFDEGLEVYTHNEFTDRLYLKPEIEIRYTSGNEISMKLEKVARGATSELARTNTKNIQFSWHLNDSVLVIDPLFYQEKNERWNFPELELVLYLPKDQKICVDNNLDENLNHAQAAGSIWTSEIPGNCWVMTKEGLDYP